MEQLKKHMNQLVAEYKEFLNLLEQQREAIVQRDLDGMYTLVEKWYLATKKRTLTEEMFSKELHTLFEQYLPGHPAPNLTLLLDVAGENDPDVRLLHTKLFDYIERANKKREEVNGILAYVQDFNAQTISLIASSVKRPAPSQQLYSSKGHSSFRSNNTLGIDQQG